MTINGGMTCPNCGAGYVGSHYCSRDSGFPVKQESVHEKLVRVIYDALDGDVSGSQAKDAARAVMDAFILKPNPMDEEIVWLPEYTKLMAERKRNSRATVPGRMSFTVLEKG